MHQRGDILDELPEADPVTGRFAVPGDVGCDGSEAKTGHVLSEHGHLRGTPAPSVNHYNQRPRAPRQRDMPAPGPPPQPAGGLERRTAAIVERPAPRKRRQQGGQPEGWRVRQDAEHQSRSRHQHVSKAPRGRLE